MLQDPENQEEWSEQVRAPNQAVALAKCQRIIEGESLIELIGISQITKTPNRQGNYKFVCWFRSESRSN